MDVEVIYAFSVFCSNIDQSIDQSNEKWGGAGESDDRGSGCSTGGGEGGGEGGGNNGS